MVYLTATKVQSNMTHLARMKSETQVTSLSQFTAYAVLLKPIPILRMEMQLQ